jgi:hypothetical protein
MMPALAVLEQSIWWLAVAGHLVLAVLFWRNGLHRTYRFFFGYLVFRVTRSALLAGGPVIVRLFDRRPNVPFATNAYAWLWILTEPVMWFFYILVVLELYSLVLQGYPGIASLSRWALMAGLTVAVGISALTLASDLSNPSEQFPILRYLFMIDRGVASSLVIFLLFITGFLVWYPVPLSRNVVVHCIAYAIYFLSVTLMDLSRNLKGSAITQVANIAGLIVTVTCLLVWIVFLNARGENKKVVVRRSCEAEEEEALVQQLAAINATLLRAARK